MSDTDRPGKPSHLRLYRALAGADADDAEGRDPEDLLRELQRRLAAFMLEYKFGIDEVLTKVTILREEFELTHDYGPIEHVKTRLKSMDSLLAKVERIGCPPSLPEIREQVRDIAGMRVTCAFVDDTYRVVEMVTAQPDLVVLETKDYIKEPKANGYQSLHVIVQVPVFLSDRTVAVPVEMQVRTIAMDFWASVEHQIRYKYDGTVPEHLGDTLLSVASTASDLDAQMGRLRSEIQWLT